MKMAVTVVHMLLRLAGAIALILGLLFWTRNALALTPVHSLAGLVVVLSLWTLAALAARAGVNLGLVVLAVVWGLIVPIQGLTQTQLLPGGAHWIIQVLHLLIGIGAIGLGERLAASIKRAQVPALQP
jgi:hypothetical protein